MNVYVVTETTGSYSQTGYDAIAAFATREAATEFATNMKALPGFIGESGGGSDASYDVVELPVWDSAPERVLRWWMWEMLGPDKTYDRKAYRVETYLPAGWTADLRVKVEPSNSPGWASLEIVAATEAEALAAYAKEVAAWEEMAAVQ